MQIRYLTEDDYQTLYKWWTDWRFSPPPQDGLPDGGKGGVMISNGDSDICAGFLYKTNSKIAWVEFIVSNFDYKDSDRGEAIELLINTLSILAKECGYSYIYTSLQSGSLIHRYEKCGYIKSSTNCTEMIKILN